MTSDDQELSSPDLTPREPLPPPWPLNARNSDLYTSADQFWLAFGVEVTVVFYLNLFVRLLLEGYGALIGIPLIAAELLVAAMWLAAGRSHLAMRVGMAGVVVVFWAVLTNGVDRDGLMAVRGLCFYCAWAAIPLMFARLLNFRITATLPTDPPPPAHVQFSITRILGLTAIVAVLLTVFRGAEWPNFRGGLEEMGLMAASAAVGLATAGAMFSLSDVGMKLAATCMLATFLGVAFSGLMRIEVVIVSNLQVLCVALLLLPFRSLGYRIRRWSQSPK